MSDNEKEKQINIERQFIEVRSNCNNAYLQAPAQPVQRSETRAAASEVATVPKAARTRTKGTVSATSWSSGRFRQFQVRTLKIALSALPSVLTMSFIINIIDPCHYVYIIRRFVCTNVYVSMYLYSNRICILCF